MKNLKYLTSTIGVSYLLFNNQHNILSNNAENDDIIDDEKDMVYNMHSLHLPDFGPSVKSDVIISKPKKFLKKLYQFEKDGPDSLFIISDFDYTITKWWWNGKRGASSHKVIEDCLFMPEWFRIENDNLRLKYYPTEVDPNLSKDEKIKYMVEWVTQAHSNIIKAGLTKDLLLSAVRNANLSVRPGISDLFHILKRKKIPLLVFSAGITQVIEEVLNGGAATLPPDSHIIANELNFDINGNAIGWNEPTFHVFNKRCKTIIDRDYFQQPNIKKRKNIILMGDSQGDMHMADGLETDNVIRIGFLNDRVKSRFDHYNEIYDIIILGDDDVSFVIELVNAICNSNGNKEEDEYQFEKVLKKRTNIVQGKIMNKIGKMKNEKSLSDYFPSSLDRTWRNGLHWRIKARLREEFGK